MSMLLDVDLAERPPTQKYERVEKESIFVGAVIRNFYDETRITIRPINDNLPKRFTLGQDLDLNDVHLYGFLFNPKGPDQFLINSLKKQKTLDLVSYNNILQEYNYSCTENFIKLSQNVFPIDPVHINRYIPNYTYETVMLFNEEIAQFQQFTTINMLVLIP